MDGPERWDIPSSPSTEPFGRPRPYAGWLLVLLTLGMVVVVLGAIAFHRVSAVYAQRELLLADACSDGNPCTADYTLALGGGCQYRPLAAGTACDEGAPCSSDAGVCDADGQCKSGWCAGRCEVDGDCPADAVGAGCTAVCASGACLYECLEDGGVPCYPDERYCRELTLLPGGQYNRCLATSASCDSPTVLRCAHRFRCSTPEPPMVVRKKESGNAAPPLRNKDYVG